MPRFYFNLCNGAEFAEDPEGVELPDYEAARRKAVESLRGVMSGTLQSLRADGLIQWHQRVIRMSQWDALMERAEFDPAYLQAQLRPEQRLRIVRAS